MTDQERRDPLELILAFEELDEQERLAAERIMAERPALRRHLARLQALERIAASAGRPAADDGFWTAEVSDAAELAALRESRERVREELGLPPGPATRTADILDHRGRRWWRRKRLLVAVAAVLAVLVIVPWAALERDAGQLRHLSVVPLRLEPDGSRSVDPGAGTGGGVRSGQAFALEFSLEHDAFLVVCHVDPLGAAQMVHPGTGEDAPRLAGGRRHLVPDPASEETWILGGETGRETFLVATSTGPIADLAGLASTVARLGGRDRQDVVAELQALLSATLDEVDRVEFSHLD